MTVSEYIFDFLQRKGLTTVYMVSGSSAMWLTDALYRNKNLRSVCCQHEQAAAMAADAYGRVTGRPGAALVTIGPGSTNAVTGVAGAYVDSSPMFVISGQANSKILQYQKDTGIRQKGTQSLVLGNMVKDITKYFAEVMNPEDIRYHMERAYYEANNGRKGPVWIDVPIDIQNRQVPNEMKGFEKPIRATSDYGLGKVKEALYKAKKPLILAGYGVLCAGVEKEVVAFAERFSIPIVTSRGGIGTICSDSSLFIGRPGSYGDRASHFAIQECDFLLILGSRLAQSTTGYYPSHLAPKAVKIMVDIDEKEHAKEDVPINIKIKANLNRFVPALIKEAEGWEYRADPSWLIHCHENKEKYPVVLPEYKSEVGINSYVFTDILSKLVPQNTNIVVDTGSVCNIVSQSWHLKSGQKYIISGGLSCMGFWASSIGAISDGNSVVVLSGDGSTQMNIQEFATLKYYNLPIKLFVYNNKGYMLIRHNQHNYMNDRFLGVGPDSGVPSVDFCALAKAYNLPCVKIDKKEDIEKKINTVFEIDGPVVCEVMVQEFGTIAPRIASRVMPDGSLKAAEFDDLWPFLDEAHDE